jgi:hypothetical protein
MKNDKMMRRNCLFKPTRNVSASVTLTGELRVELRAEPVSLKDPIFNRVKVAKIVS